METPKPSVIVTVKKRRVPAEKPTKTPNKTAAVVTQNVVNKTTTKAIDRSFDESDTELQALMKAIDTRPTKADTSARPMLYLVDGHPEKINHALELYGNTDIIIVDPSKDPLTQPDHRGKVDAAYISVIHQQALEQMKTLIDHRTTFVLNAHGFTTMVLRRLLRLAFMENYIIVHERDISDDIHTY